MPFRLREHLAIDVTRNVGQAEVAALEFVGEPRVVDAEAVQRGGLNVVNRYRIADDVVGKVVGLADHVTGLDAAAGEPHGKAARMVVAAVIVLGEMALAVDGAPEFAAPDDERVVEKPALLEIGNERC